MTVRLQTIRETRMSVDWNTFESHDNFPEICRCQEMEFQLQERHATSASSSLDLVEHSRKRSKMEWFVKVIQLVLVTLLISNLVAVIFVAVVGFLLILDASESDDRIRSYKAILITGMSIVTITSLLFYSLAILATFKHYIKILLVFIILNIIMMIMVGIKTDSSQSYLNLTYHSIVTLIALIFCRLVKSGCVWQTNWYQLIPEFEFQVLNLKWISNHWTID